MLILGLLLHSSETGVLNVFFVLGLSVLADVPAVVDDSGVPVIEKLFEPPLTARWRDFFVDDCLPNVARLGEGTPFGAMT